MTFPKKTTPLPQKITCTLAVLTLLTITSLFLPFTKHVEINETEEQTLITYTMLYQAPIAWIFAANFLMVALAALSFSRVLAIIINSVVLVWSFLLFMLLQYLFVWDGQPIHPTFSYGYSLNQVTLIALIVFSFSWIRSFREQSPSRTYVRRLTVATLAIPVAMIPGIYLAERAENNRPVMRSVWRRDTDTKFIKQESWDYMETYGAYVNKYYSKDRPADTLTYDNRPYRLDSVNIMFFDENTEVKREITQRAINGKIDLESLLENNRYASF